MVRPNRIFVFVCVLLCTLLLVSASGDDSRPPEADDQSSTVATEDSARPADAAASDPAKVSVHFESFERFDGTIFDLPPIDLSQRDGTTARPRRWAAGFEPLADRPGEDDPVWQKHNGPVSTSLTGPILNFDGQTTDTDPHDPVGDVGPNHYVQGINSFAGGSAIGIWNKAGVFVGGFGLDSLWTSGPCNIGAGDPIVLYDQQADRWFLAHFSGTSNTMCMAVSQTPNPAGAYFLYAFGTGSFPDYPKFGVWPDPVNNGYYMTANFGGSALVAWFDRPTMLAGGGAPGSCMTTVPGNPGQGFNILMPSDLDGPPAPAGTPNHFYRNVDGTLFGGLDRVEIFTMTPTCAPVGPVSVALSPFDSTMCGLGSFSCVPQSGGPNLDPVAEVAMWRLQYRNFGSHQTLVGNFTVDTDGANTAGVRWFELRRVGAGPWSLFQDGTFAPQNGGALEHRWMGSAAMDADGNLAIAYSLSGTGTVPEIHYAGRCAADPPGTLPRGELTIHPGGGAENTSRWGDYSSLNLDPSDGLTFWYTNDYHTGAVRQTRIASFAFNCAVAPFCGDLIVTPPEGCDPPGSLLCDCCFNQGAGSPGCQDPGCEAAICAADSFCCNTTWDQVCANAALAEPACAACCSQTCGPNCDFCSDNIVTPPEQCDDGNTVPGDGCDAVCLLEAFCGNGLLDPGESCEPPGAFGSDCCESHSAGCSDATCEATICAADAFCCNSAWDSLCAGAALADAQCAGSCLGLPSLLDKPYSGDCCSSHSGVGCSDPTCEAVVCAGDPFCCNTQWDGACSRDAMQASVECAPNCLPLLDACDGDCTFCGDGDLNIGETCDDDNNLNGDGCSSTCQIETFCGDGIITPPETCDPPGAFGSDCCEDKPTPGCSDPTCEATICGADAFCCNTQWDSTCANSALADPQCAGSCLGSPYSGDVPYSGDCCEVHAGAGCSDPTCEAAVCGLDPFCCNTSWDGICAGEAVNDFPVECAPNCLPVPPGCDADCTYCGDLNVDPDEECDDGNNLDNDGCSSQCIIECGNGIIDPSETCDPPGAFGSDCCETHTAGCSDATCEATICGADAFCCNTSWDSACAGAALLDPQCAGSCLGSPYSGDAPYSGDCCDVHASTGCSDPTCEAAVCGVDAFCCNTSWDGTCAGEAVDDFPVECAPNCLPLQAGCDADCTYCGDFNVEPDEECDDGANVDGDGCSSVCIVEFCGDGTTQPGLGEECDDGGNVDGDGCSSVCIIEFCGDGTTQAGIGEECDDGGNVDGDGCSASCIVEFCGDGITQPGLGEECDDGGNVDGDGCNASCIIEFCGDGITQPGIGEECDGPDAPQPTDCCVANGTPGCGATGCEAQVCEFDPFCCNVSWDLQCSVEAEVLGCCPAQCTGACCIDSDGDGSCDGADVCPGTPNGSGSSDCCVDNGTPGCSDPACELEICGIDPFCCNTSWDAICAGEALRNATCLPGCGGGIFAETIVAVDKVTFGWLTPQSVEWVRGNLFAVSTYGTVGGGLIGPGTALPAPELPPGSGQGLWWLVKPDCPGGSWWSGGPAECGTLDTCTAENRDFNLP